MGQEPARAKGGHNRMHGLINLAIQNFVTDSYGPQMWQAVAHAARLPDAGIEAMLRYDLTLTEAVLGAACTALNQTPDALLEDLGTYLVSHPNTEVLRRLLRFGGVNFLEFLHSLDELPGRAQLAVEDLDMPQLELVDLGHGEFRLNVRSPIAGFAPVMMGVLRAMADDYGALVLIAPVGRHGDGADIAITLLDSSFAAGRGFALAAGGAGGGG
jgi:hypothetical protein